jgi:hypothetical protein
VLLRHQQLIQIAFGGYKGKEEEEEMEQKRLHVRCCHQVRVLRSEQPFVESCHS